MKTVFNYSLMVGFILFLSSCGGSTETKVEDKVKEEVKKEVNEEVIKSNIDINESRVLWKGEMLGIYAHEGSMNFNNGMVKIENGKLVSGNFSVDMGSMIATDKNYKPKEGKTPEKLIGHLSSADFFDVANHKTATFKITSVNGNEAKGKLTVRGVTSDEKVKNVMVNVSGNMAKLTGNLTFDRQKYGVAYSAGKDAVLSDNIDLSITIIANL